MHSLEPPQPDQMSDAARVVAICLHTHGSKSGTDMSYA